MMKKYCLILLAVIAATITGYAQQLSRADYQDLKVRAEKQNDAEAQYLLGNYFYQGMVPGFDSDDSYRGAAQYWAMARVNKHPRATGNLGFCYRNGIGVQPDSIRAINLYVESIELGNDELVEQMTRSARQGSVFDALVLYKVYSEGLGEKKDPSLAVEYLTIAADNGEPRANLILGNEYYRNRDYDNALKRYQLVPDPSQEVQYRVAELTLDNDPAAVETIENLAMDGYLPAITKMGEIYYKGLGGADVDFGTAAFWNRRALIQGSPTAAMTLANQLILGQGVDTNYDEAIYLLDIAVPYGYNKVFRESLKGDWAATPFYNYLVGISYARMGNYDEATRLLKLAKKDKVPGAETQLALIDAAKGDATKAFKAVLKLAKKGQVPAYSQVANMYLNATGTPRDLDAAEKYARLGADAGDVASICVLGDVYMERGDYAAAVDCYEKALQTGILLPQARANFVKCLNRGLGCETDTEFANMIKKAVPTDRLIDIYRVAPQVYEEK